MASISNQLATLTEAVSNLRGWIREKFKQVNDDHDEQIALKKDVEQLQEKLAAFDRLKVALIVAIVGAGASAIFGAIVAAFNVMSKGEPAP